MTCSFDPASARALVGSIGSAVRRVGAVDTAIALGSGDLPVLATPIMIALMEAAACDALDGHLPAGCTSVGSRVDVRHLAPSTVGTQVRAHARITEIRGAKVTFEVSASHESGGGAVEIGVGTHVRAVVSREAFPA